MSIVRTKKYSRTDASVSFYRDSSEPAVSALNSGTLQSLKDSGAITSEATFSPDNLLMLVTQTAQDFEALSAFDTALSLEIDAEFTAYGNAHSQSKVGETTLTGIDSAFTVTYVYTFPSAGLSSHDLLSALVSTYTTVHPVNATSNTIGDTTITLVTKFLTETEFTANSWSDFLLATNLHADGVTRTITYAEVTE